MKMTLEILLLIIAIVFLLCVFTYFAPVLLSPSFPSGLVCIGKSCFNVEIASTEMQREKGLMFRKKIGENEGMLFIFNKEGVYPFWMKNTLIPLDIIWINNNKVVFINENSQPCKNLICPQIIPPNNAKYVLEINAGACRKANIKVADELSIKINNFNR